MSEQFGRAARVTVGDVLIEADPLDGLRVQFRVDRTARPEPNTIDVSISNLSKATRDRIQATAVPVIVEAGYGDKTEVLGRGDCRTVLHRHDGTEWVTRVQAGDGERAYKGSRVHESFAPGSSQRDLIKKAMESMKLEMRDALLKVLRGDWKGGQETFWHGATASGKSASLLTDALSSGGYSWSIQDGKIEILAANETTGEQAILLGSSAGLIGTPEAGEDGTIKARALLNGGLRPGRRIVVSSSHVDGTYRVERVTHLGDSRGQEWYSEVEGKLI